MNAKIQEGYHSSIIDSRATLGLFLKLKSSYGLEVDGIGIQWMPNYDVSLGGSDDSTACYVKNRRRNRRGGPPTLAQMVGRQTFKTLDCINESNEPFKPVNDFKFSPKHDLDLPKLTELELCLQKLILNDMSNPVLKGDTKIMPSRVYKINK